MSGQSSSATDRTDASLSAYVADFIVGTEAREVPTDVVHLGKRSILDGLGLALAGAASMEGSTRSSRSAEGGTERSLALGGDEPETQNRFP